MKTNSDPRHTSRKLALSSVFSWLFTDPDIKQSIILSKEVLQEEGIEYDDDLTEYLVEGVKRHAKEIDEKIMECAPEWPLNKIAKIDLMILRIAVFELLFGKKAPIKVTIDEAVEIAKEFGNDTSHKFVNGVLGTVVDKYLKNEKK